MADAHFHLTRPSFTSSYEDATSKTYDANCLNQYTEIDVTGGKQRLSAVR